MSQWDELSEQISYSEEDQAKHQKLNYLMHKVFAQTEEGRELLELWTHSLILHPVNAEGNDLFNLGRQEGRKSFIRDLITTVRSVENE